MKEVLRDDPAAVISYIAGNTLVMTFFITLGICVMIYLHYANTKNKAVGMWLAWSLILCGLSRAMGIMCVWYGVFYSLYGIISVITGMSSIVTLILMIPVVRKIVPLRDLEDLNQAMIEAEEKLRTLQKLKNENAR